MLDFSTINDISQPSSNPETTVQTKAKGSQFDIHPGNPPPKTSVPCTKLRSQLHPEHAQPATFAQIPFSSSAAITASTNAAAQVVLAEQGTGTMAIDIEFDLSKLEKAAIKQEVLLQKLRQTQVDLANEIPASLEPIRWYN